MLSEEVVRVVLKKLGEDLLARGGNDDFFHQQSAAFDHSRAGVDSGLDGGDIPCKGDKSLAADGHGDMDFEKIDRCGLDRRACPKG